MVKTKNNPKKLLTESGLKATFARMAILKIFSRLCKPLNTSEVYKKVRAKKIDSVTVYRTLKTFEQKKILRIVDLRRESVYYELDLLNHHHHISCLKCKIIEPINFCDINYLSEKIMKQSKKFTNINQHSLELFGLCKACSRR